MKRSIIQLIVLSLTAALILTACSGGGAGSTDNGGTTSTNLSPLMSYVPAPMVYIESSLSFTIENPIFISRTEIPYELWYTVYSWAVDNGYTFMNFGREGNDGTEGAAPTADSLEPVTGINFCDTVVWCNALTEWTNSNLGTSYTCVYRNTDTDSILRDSSIMPVAPIISSPIVDTVADGFRLPTYSEWIMSASYINDLDNDGAISAEGEFYPGIFASGADAPVGVSPGVVDFDGDGDSESTDEVAVYADNSNGFTAPTGSKSPNALGLYDMSGNISEFVFADVPILLPLCSAPGGSWFGLAAEFQRNGIDIAISISATSDTYGFRVARTATSVSDQKQLESNKSAGNYVNWQTITAGKTGYLADVQVELGNPLKTEAAEVSMSIIDGADNSGDVLGSVSISIDGYRTMRSFSFSGQNICLQEEAQYTLRIETAEIDQSWVGLQTGDSYPGGRCHVSNEEYDLCFETYIFE